MRVFLVNRNLSFRFLIAGALLLAACMSARQQQPKTALRWKSLHLLPGNISRDDLLVTMRGWSQSLGVSCDHCHVQLPPAEPGGKEKSDFVSDSKPQKRIARAMLVMTRRMNSDYIAGVAKNGGSVSCYTCHRGKVTPDWKLPPLPRA